MSLELEREHTVQLLCRHFALDHLTTQELEARLDAAYKAQSVPELRALIHALPAVPLHVSDPQLFSVAPASAESPPDRRVLAVFGRVEKGGEWEPGQHTHARAIFGQLELDFRDARIPAGVTTVEVMALFGEVRIIVPPGLRVESDGTAILGEFSAQSYSAGLSHPDAPTIRIVGHAVFGAVSVVRRLPREGALEALKREWREQ